ncbi:SHRM1 protein, partial [Calyptomena viridis]|nr:SHRM1 protein [Calyptomena viridis]
LQTQLWRQPWEGCAGEQITRHRTPMLFYLSGGKPSHIPPPNKLSPCQEDSRGSAKEMPSSSCTGSALQVPRERALEVPRERHQLQGNSPQHGDSAGELLLHTQHLLPAEESFTHDYRERLKVAQKKVLRETSFKRKDLQMSLPVRLRQKPCKRPSIEHLRSFSLSSAAEGAKPGPRSPSHLQALESFNRDEEIRRPQIGRVGGRKRVSKEEKKLCYSEPEKLDQLLEKEMWSQVRDEITEQDLVAARRRALENGGRALSSSSLSRTELKQIQHSALMEYMERKRSQRPGGSQQLPLHRGLSHPKGPPGKVSNPNGSRKMQNDEVFCQVLPKEKSADASPALACVAPLGMSSRS